MKKNNNYKLSKIMQYELSDSEIYEMETDYEGDIDKWLVDNGFGDDDGNV
ncbi:hypothetical protein [Methanoculleus sp.]|nr:hypothetical protein [Methanoculleus sp.]MCK9320016.1 hypothetical protein [Methanoculleus sp.]